MSYLIAGEAVMEDNTYQSSLWSGGLIAVSLVILQGFLSLSSLDTAAFISVFAFAFAIPVLTCNILVNFSRRKATARASIQEILFYMTGMVAAVVGVAAAFWHICRIATVIFSASTFIALIVYFKLVPYKHEM